MIATSVRALLSGFAVALLLIGAGAPLRAAAQTAPGESRGIVATGNGRASAPATTATVRIYVSSYLYGGMEMVTFTATGSSSEATVASSGHAVASPEAVESGASSGEAGSYGESVDVEEPAVPAVVPAMTAADATPVVDALVAAGVSRDAIEVVTSTASIYGPGAPSALQIRFDLSNPVVDQIAALATAAREAASGAGLNLDFFGVTYGGADCAALEQQARAAAVADAQGRAEGLADALGVQLGDLIQAADYSFGPMFDSGTGACGPPVGPGGGFIDYGYGGVQPFNPETPAVVVVYASVTLTYAFETAEATA